MLESGTWLHITCGSLIGIVSTVFIYKTAKLSTGSNKILSYFGFLVLYTLAISCIVYLYAIATSGGLLIQWQLLGFPSLSDKGVKILGVGYVQAKSGNIYHWTNPYSNGDGQWEQVEVAIENPELNVVSECRSNTLSFLPIKRKDFVDFKEACISWGPGPSKTAYAIDDGGRVYLWFHGTGEYGGIERIILPIFWGILSCGFGLLVILILLVSSKLNKGN